MSSNNKRSKRGADFELDQNNADQYHREMDHGTAGGGDGGGGGGYGIPRASDAELRSRRIVRVRAPPGESGGGAHVKESSSSFSPTRSKNPFAAVNLIAANSSSSGVSTAAPAATFLFGKTAAATSASFQPPAAATTAAAANPFGSLFQPATTVPAVSSTTTPTATPVTPYPDCLALDGKLKTRLLEPQLGRATTTTTQRSGAARTSNIRELLVAYVHQSESIASDIDQAKEKKGEVKSAAPAPALKPLSFSFSAPAASVDRGTGGGGPGFGSGAETAGKVDNNNDNDGDDEDAPQDDDVNDPSFSATRTVDEGYDALGEYENIAVYRMEPDGKFKRLTQSKVVLQQSQSQPTLSRLIVRQPRGGISVLLNMVVQGSYKYKERVDPKRKMTFGQIGFLGCNSQAEGFKTYAFKAPADIAKPLHKQLEELAAVHDAAKGN